MKKRNLLLLSALFIGLFPSISAAKIVGKVVDQFGRGLHNVHIKIAKTGFETNTDKKGNYSIAYVPGKLNITYSKAEYTTIHLELDIYTKDRVPAEKIKMWRIPKDGIYLVDNKTQKYRNLGEGFHISNKSKMHHDPNSLETLENLEDIATLAFYAPDNGSFRIPNGKVVIVDTVPKSVGLYKKGKNNIVFGLRQGAFGKIAGIAYNGEVLDEEITNIGDEKLTVRTFDAKDGVYIFSETETIRDGFGAKALIPKGLYFPLIVGYPSGILGKGQANSLSADQSGLNKGIISFKKVQSTLEYTRTKEPVQFMYEGKNYTMIIQKTYRVGKTPCRDFILKSKQSTDTTGSACREHSGVWKEKSR